MYSFNCKYLTLINYIFIITVFFSKNISALSNTNVEFAPSSFNQFIAQNDTNDFVIPESTSDLTTSSTDTKQAEAPVENDKKNSPSVDAPIESNSNLGGSKHSKEGKVIYEYKKEDYFNFDALNVKGELLTPGDLSSKATKRAKYSPSKYTRKNFDDYIVGDLLEVY